MVNTKKNSTKIAREQLKRRHMKHLLLLFLALGFWLLALGAKAQAIEIGVIDVMEVASEHPMKKQFEDELEKTRKTRTDEFQEKAKKQFGVTDLNDLKDAQKEQFQAMFTVENDKFNAEMKKKYDDNLKIIEGDILKVVQKIAQQKKLTYVFDKSVVLFGGMDITDEAVTEIEKMK